MLTGSPKTVSVPKDTVAPSITDVYIKDLSASGYTVHCIVRDDKALGYVSFPTWTDNTDISGNPQDDIVWGSAGDISGTSWELNYRVNISDHNNEVNCGYNTHIYCYDASGNGTAFTTLGQVFVENTPPIISDVKITDISESGYTVSCVVNDDYSGINRVQFPTWYENNNPYAIDGSWITSAFCSGKLENRRFVYRVNTSDYGNQLGKYTTHIYAWDECGNRSDCYETETLIKKHKHEYISNIKKSATCTEAGIMLYTCKDNDDSYEEEIPATGHQNTELRNAKESTCTQEGYTGDSYCKDCGAKIATGQKIDKIEHNWDSGKVTKEPTSKETGTKTYTCTICKTTKAEEIPVTEKDQNLVTEGWKKNSKGWWYQNSDGSYPKNQWKKVGENWYHFDANGYMQTGWLQLGSNRYYLKSTGVMAKDEWVDNGKSYVDADGKYVPGKTKYTEGWKKNTKGWWYQNSDGSHPKNQWKKIGENWYHFDASGYMQTGWLQIGSNWYYLKSTGVMAKDEWVDNGKSYVDADGKYVPGKAKYTEGWKKNTKGWWYQNGDGSYPRNQWKKINGNWYHFDANGYMQTGWLKIGTIWYYLKSNGAMASNEWILNGQYFMDANGHLT